ncbi:hypothetical protein ABPG75_008975 [Micractinium tetrahymenae]
MAAESQPGQQQHGPPRLAHLAELVLLRGIHQASRIREPPFSVGGSLGRLDMALAVQPEAGDGALVVRGPDGAPEALAALRAACAPASGDADSTVATVPADRVFPQFELGQHPGVLAAVHSLLLPAAGELTPRLRSLTIRGPGSTDFVLAHNLSSGAGCAVSLVVCLPTAHSGGALRAEHSGRSVTYDWAPGAAGGEVQWAAFPCSCMVQLAPVQTGVQAILAYNLFEHSGGASQAVLSAGPLGATSPLLQALSSALSCEGFLLNGGRLGFPCKHSYPGSLSEGVTEEAVRRMLRGEDSALLLTLEALAVPCKLVRVWQAVRRMLRGEDSALLLTLEALAVPCKLVRVWQDDWEYTEDHEEQEFRKGLFVGPILPGVQPGELHPADTMPNCWLESEVQANMDDSIIWLGGEDSFSEWVVGGQCIVAGSMGCYEPTTVSYMCSLAIVVEVPPLTHRKAASSALWAGGSASTAGVAGDHPEASMGSPGAAPLAKRAKLGRS